MIQIILPFALPTLNEIIAAASHNRFKYGAMKKKFDRKVLHEILTQVNPISQYNSVKLDIIWIESSKKRDPDNVFGGGCKFICDSLIKAKIISNDTRDEIKGISNSVRIEKDRGVEITIIPNL